jgi:pSer/pThr/pTyr-binding forkhead associated (FHA) protein
MDTTYDLHVAQSVILGRKYEGLDVDVDLTPFNAAEAGVSRQHVMIAPQGNCFIIQDLESRNGTVLNGEKLLPRQPYKLHDGDMVFIGRLAVTIRYVTDGARLNKRSPHRTNTTTATPDTKMLGTPETKTRTVEMQGLLKRLGNEDGAD